MSATWSKYQNAIFDFAQFGQGNAIVEAVAGSGKSTTIVEALNRRTSSSAATRNHWLRSLIAC